MGNQLPNRGGARLGNSPQDRAPQLTADGIRPGIEAWPRPFLMENHDQAYWVWQEAGVKGKILVHVDAHDDLSWTADQKSLNIGNYISQALKEGIVREVFWVVPDQTVARSQNLRPVLRRLQRLRSKYPEPRAPIIPGREQVDGALLGKPLRVCSWRSLPRFSEEVLLDIDVDYLLIPRACHDHESHGGLPWLWPEELLNGLKTRGLKASLVTVAYSVEGGYTPLKWKYLGDELALRLKGDADARHLRGMSLMRAGAQAASEGNRLAAEADYLKARELLPQHPAPGHHLARLYLEMGDPVRAQECYQDALALDPSYRTPYNSQGLWYYWLRRWPEAESEYLRTLALDPEDAYAHFGLGKIAARRRRWQEAEFRLRKSLQFNGELVDAYRTLGKVLSKQGRRREAIAAYERSLQLTLAGRKPLKAPILSNLDEHPFLDPDHFRVHTLLARLYEQEGEIGTAIVGYRMGIASGGEGFWSRYRLASLYFKKRHWQASCNIFWQALKKLPDDVKHSALSYYYRLKLALRNRVGRAFTS